MYLIPNKKNLFAFTAMLFFFSTSFSWGGSSLNSTEVQSLHNRVSSSANDAEERTNGRVYLKGSDLKMVSDRGRLQTIGIRFPNLRIPKNATVTKAYIQFKSDERSSENTRLTIYAENTDHASVFSSASYNISKRIKTGVSASWSPVGWKSIGEARVDQRTSDLTSIVQNIISRSGWKSGNAMAFIFTGSGKRVAESYDGDTAGAPKLYVEYTITDNEDSSEPTPTTHPTNTPPTANAQSDKTVQVNHTVTISGSASDSDGKIAKYEWKKQSNGQVLARTASFNFTPTGTDTKTFVFTVTDNDGARVSDTMRLTVTDGPVIDSSAGNTPPTADTGNTVHIKNTPPTANAQSDKTVQVNHTVTISGSASDSDGKIAKYEWKKQSNGQVLARTASFNFTPTGTNTKTFVFTVTDNDGARVSDTMRLVVTNGPVGDSSAGNSSQAANAVHSGQVKNSSTGKGLANVKVSLGGSTAVTNTNGFYTLSNLAENEKAVVNFEKEGYLLGSTHIQIKTDASNYLEYGMRARTKQWNYNSSSKVNNAHIMIDASVSYRNSKGNIYNGTNTAELIYFDITTTEGKELFPGAFKGINSNGVQVQFHTYGLISILLEDSNGDKLSLADGETATLRFDAVSSLGKPDTLPLWSYDYKQGVWSEEGYAQLQEDGTYKGEISHLGTWSLNRPIEGDPGIYRSRIIFEDQTSAKDVRVYAVGSNWISSDLSTDEDGVFEIEVIPGKSFQLTAYNCKDKYKASYNNTIEAIASGDVVED